MNQVTIVGTGPAGLTAAIYAARGGYEPVVYAGSQHGGQLTTTTDVENWPGFVEGIMGPKLMTDMTAQAERVGTKVIYEEITGSDLSGKPLKLWAGDKEIETKTLIIATGATAKTLGLPDENKLMGRGVSTCATCDGFFYKNQKVAVVGGGDSAMEESTYLAKLCSEVILIHRRPTFRASNIMLERARNNPKIRFMVPYVVTDTISDETGLTGIKVQNRETEEVSELDVAGFFMAIGHRPNSEVFREYLDTDENGYINVQEHTKTNVPGVFSAGDISDSEFRQAVTAAGMGCQAAMQAMRYLEANETS